MSVSDREGGRLVDDDGAGCLQMSAAHYFTNLMVVWFRCMLVAEFYRTRLYHATFLQEENTSLVEW